MAHKVVAPAGAILHGPYANGRPDVDLWWVHGTLYIDLDQNPEHVAYLRFFRRKSGYVITEGETVPADYRAQVVDLKAQAQLHRRSAVAMQDGFDPGRLNYSSGGSLRVDPQGSQ